jgi:hypothetical protein
MSEVKEAVKEIKLKPATEELAARIKKELTFDHKSGVATITKDFYASTLPEGITVNLIEQLQDHNTVIAAAAGLAFGQASETFLKKNKDFPRTEFELPTVRKDGFEFTYDRTRQVPTRNADGTTGTRAAHGMLRVGYRTYGAESVGELKKVKSLLSESAARVLGD